jgi:hypothetical protein
VCNIESTTARAMNIVGGLPSPHDLSTSRQSEAAGVVIPWLIPCAGLRALTCWCPRCPPRSAHRVLLATTWFTVALIGLLWGLRRLQARGLRR